MCYERRWNDFRGNGADNPMTPTTQCRDYMGSLVCQLKEGHKGNHKYKRLYWNKRGLFLGKIDKGN